MKNKTHLILMLTVLFASTAAFNQSEVRPDVIEIATSEVEIDFDYEIKAEVFPITIDLKAEILSEKTEGSSWKWEMNGEAIGEGEAITAYPVERDCAVKLILLDENNEPLAELTKNITIKNF